MISPADVIMLKAYVAEPADVMKNIASKQIIRIEITVLSGYSLKTIKTAVSGEAINNLTASRLQSPVVLKAIVPNTESQIIVNTVGINTTPKMNSRMVLPLDILAMNIPTMVSMR